MDCEVCCSTSKSIQCAKCSYIACIKCCQQFLLSREKPQCMCCGDAWNELFLRDHFPIAWLEKQYKAHKKTVVLEYEKSFLPESMPYVSSYKKYKSNNTSVQDKQELQICNESLRETDRELTSLVGQKGSHISARRKFLRDSQRVLRKKKTDLLNTINAQNHQVRMAYYDILHDKPLESDEKHYNYPCTKCRGFLDEKWQCGLCNVVVCKTCRCEKGADHVCSSEVVASVKEIMNDSRECPKCKEPISRTFGCDHMWCIFCHTSFSYASGKAIKDSQNTNPLYLQYLDKQGDREHLGLSGMIVEAFERRHNQKTKRMGSFTLLNMFESFIYSLASIATECNETTPSYPHGKNRMIRVKYLAGDCTEEELAEAAFREVKRYEYDVILAQFRQDLSERITGDLLTIHEFLSTNSAHNIFEELCMKAPVGHIEEFNSRCKKLSKQFAYTICNEYSQVRWFKEEGDVYTILYTKSDCEKEKCNVIGWNVTSVKVK